MSATFIDPVFLMRYPQDPPVCDYRSVVNASGTEVIFERWVNAQPGHQNPHFVLYQVNLMNDATQAPFLNGTPALNISTRPDWSWATRQRLHSATARASGSLVTMAATRCCCQGRRE